MIGNFYRGLIAIIAAKFLFWRKPALKIVLRNFLICALFIILVIYSHREFINWSEISGNTEYLSLSFIAKNVLIILSLIVLVLSVKKSKHKYDGFCFYSRLQNTINIMVYAFMIFPTSLDLWVIKTVPASMRGNTDSQFEIRRERNHYSYSCFCY